MQTSEHPIPSALAITMESLEETEMLENSKTFLLASRVDPLLFYQVSVNFMLLARTLEVCCEDRGVHGFIL